MNKKHISLLIVTATIAFSSVLWLANRREIIDITSLMASRHATATTQTSAQKETSETVAKSGKDRTPHTINIRNSKKGNTTSSPTTQDMGTICAEETEIVSPPGSDGVVRRSKVTIPDEAFDWAKPNHYPKVGDLLRISIPVDHEFLIEVLSFETRPNGKDLVILGDLHGGRGRVSLMIFEEHFSLLITDEEQRRTYNIYYDVRQNYYSVEETDTSLLTPQRGCSTVHEINEDDFFSELNRAKDTSAPEPDSGL